MRKLLILALLLYDVIVSTRSIDEYIDNDVTKHSFVNDRRNWRKKALQKPEKQDDDLRPPSSAYYAAPRYMDDAEGNFGVERHNLEGDPTGYRNQRRNYDDNGRMGPPNGFNDAAQPMMLMEKQVDRKPPLPMSCERQHERFEPCFSGCAAVSCDNPRERMRPCYPFCEAGCICIRPYVRDDRTHKCVLPEECTKSLKGIPDLSEDI